ncbi:hypothetical protein JCM10207_003747 [Rhodosporidiobolus poonsookiae]
MAYGYSAVFYGAFVKTLHLIAAAKAWPSLEPTLLAVDLISLRRNMGKLEVEIGASTSVTRLPVELWSEIKLALIDVELEDAYKWISKDELWCGDCLEPPVADPSGIDFDCDGCFDVFVSEGQLVEMLHGQVKNLSALLNQHHLYRPSQLIHNGERTNYCDIDSLSAIAWQHSRTETMSASFEGNSDDYVHGHGVHSLDPLLLSRSPAFATRIRAFSRLFRLPFYDPNTYFSSSKEADESEPATSTEEPRWHFWASVEEEF